jgi:hypothetical protein
MNFTIPRENTCSSRTARRRVQEVAAAQNWISGGEGAQLLEKEITTLSVESRRQLLQKAGITVNVQP